MPPASSSRLAYIDWLRGLACVLMFQTHCYDAWLGGAARDSQFAMWSHLGGTFPAPLFLFLAGISVAIITDKQLQKGIPARQAARKVIVRGAEILGIGLLFRVQEYVISWGWAPWSDLFRVDILNTIGVSIMLMGAMCWSVLLFGEGTRSPGRDRPGALGGVVEARGPDLGVRPYKTLLSVAVLTTAVISSLTPLLWTTWRPRFLPWELESYINGVHNLGSPQPWLFPIFPWTGFAFAGLAVGFILVCAWGQKLGGWIFLGSGISGLALICVAKLMDASGLRVYPVYDYWHTSPSFFVTRVGWLLLFAMTAYAWCRWGFGHRGFSPLIQLGHTSLLVYWVHIEFVYGRFSILKRRNETIEEASFGLVIIFLSMSVLSVVRTKSKGSAGALFPWAGGSSRAGA